MNSPQIDARQIRGTFLEAGLAELPGSSYQRFVSYLELLLRWNARLNLTAIREPGEIVRRHFVESAFAAQNLPAGIGSVLDFGSGAGFPGIPIAICRPEIRVTLAEAQGKKASFLREAARTMDIGSEVYEGRVESMPPERRFTAVTLRAVEKMEVAIPVAAGRAEWYLGLLIGAKSAAMYQRLAPEFRWASAISLPNAVQSILMIGERTES